MEDYEAQLLVVEAKLVKDPQNEELLSYKADLLETIELLGGEQAEQPSKSSGDTNAQQTSKAVPTASRCDTNLNDPRPSGSEPKEGIVFSGRKPLTEAELEARRKEKNRKKKAKLREKMKEQLDIAESEKQSWQSFASKKGLKGITKKSIFASPISTTGKVGVGTNGIADAPALGAGSRVAHNSANFATGAKRKH